MTRTPSCLSLSIIAPFPLLLSTPSSLLRPEPHRCWNPRRLPPRNRLRRDEFEREGGGRHGSRSKPTAVTVHIAATGRSFAFSFLKTNRKIREKSTHMPICHALIHASPNNSLQFHRRGLITGQISHAQSRELILFQQTKRDTDKKMEQYPLKFFLNSLKRMLTTIKRIKRRYVLQSHVPNRWISALRRSRSS